MNISQGAGGVAIKPGGMSSYYKCWLPCQDGSGTTILDRSQNAANATIGASAAAGAWANAGYFTNAANASTDAAFGAVIPVAKTAVDWRANYWLLSMRVKKAAGFGGSLNFFGSGGDGDSPGFRLLGHATGRFEIAINRGAQLGLGTSNANTTWNGAEHVLTFYYDGPNGVMYQFFDGLPDASGQAEPTVSAGVGSGIFTGDIGLGFSSNTTNAMEAVQFRDIHLLAFDKEPPSVNRLVKLLAGRALQPITDQEIGTFPARDKTRRVFALVAQSNERGNGENSANVGVPLYGYYGPPTQDPVQPNGDAVAPSGGSFFGSLWPRLVSRLWDEGGTSLIVKNTAVGGTSIVTDWCGESAGMPLADGDVGFDPNSYFSTAWANVSSFRGEIFGVISLGQNDAAAGTSFAAYRQGVINAANYFLNRGAKAVIGFTGYGGSSSSWYQDVGSPAVRSALAYFAGNPNVLAGANLFDKYGTTLAQGPTPGHFAYNEYIRWADLWFDVLHGQGW